MRNIKLRSIQCCKINSLPLIQLLCVIIQNYAQGALIKPSGNSAKERLLSYCRSTFYRSVSLLANGCQGIGFLAGKAPEVCYEYGAHIAIALKAISDIKEFKDGDANFWGYPALLAHAREGEDVHLEIERGQGLVRTQTLALMHIKEAVNASRKLSQSQELEELASGLIGKIL